MMGLSNFGQTFFIALYSAELRSAFGLSNAGFGGLYSAMTLLSALVMVFTGRFIDSWRLRHFTLFVLVGLAVGCIVMGMVQHIIGLAVALFLLRHFGQGLSSHTGITATARAFDKNRGQATSLVQLGYSSFEGLLPLTAVLVMAWIGWQQSWLLYALVLVMVAIPLQMLLVGAEPDAAKNQSDEAAAEAQTPRAMDRRAMLRDRRFYMMMPLHLAPPFLLTGMFFHQVQLADVRGWHIETLAAAFSFYAFFKIIVSLLAGVLIDRYSAVRLVPFAAVPLVMAFGLLVSPNDSALMPFIYMGLIGANLGMVAPMRGGLWAELFGTKHLGAIRSLVSPIVIMSTAASPVLFGIALDAGIGFETLALASIVFIAVASLLAFLVPDDKLST